LDWGSKKEYGYKLTSKNQDMQSKHANGTVSEKKRELKNTPVQAETSRKLLQILDQYSPMLSNTHI
jgi:hypothetical protein